MEQINLTPMQWDLLRFLGPKTTYNYVSTATPGANVQSIRSIQNEKEFYLAKHEEILYAKMDISDYHVEDTSRYGPSMYFYWDQSEWVEIKDLAKKQMIDQLKKIKIDNPPSAPF
jgi:hypothetical protein